MYSFSPFSGKNYCLPCLPRVPGDEGVGEVVEVGKFVSAVELGERVVLTARLLGTWRNYAIFQDTDVHVISPNLCIPEAAMLAISPCMAYRMIKDFRHVLRGETIIQNAANSPCGQCIIQLCKAWEINTINIVASHCRYYAVKEHLLSIGATAVYTLEEAEQLLYCYDTSLLRPVLGFNCLGGRYENVMLKMLQNCGTMVYYGCAFELPNYKERLRCDCAFYNFHIWDWYRCAPQYEIDKTLIEIMQLMITGKFIAPMYELIELKNYIEALRNTVHCEAFSTNNYVFDFTVP